MSSCQILGLSHLLLWIDCRLLKSTSKPESEPDKKSPEDGALVDRLVTKPQPDKEAYDHECPENRQKRIHRP